MPSSDGTPSGSSSSRCCLRCGRMLDMAELDLVIRGGTLIYGTGAPPRTADVGIAGGRIVEVGRLAGGAGAPASRTGDADGALVPARLVDIQTHYDSHGTWDPRLQPSA